ncbi:MAG: sugar phosphate isomerase/epimerase [Rhodococcus sp. (in: high G+C Gram-positive bacteria)]|nr:MAG: sugar phosphate isomerase/epimerase [Rhodococcus sp. (in: high G+C Gram-positive bacteria)]
MHTRISVSGLCFPTLDLAASLGALHDVGAGWTTLQARKFRETGWDRGIERVESSGIAVAGLVAEFPEDLGDPQTWTVSRAKMIEALDAAAALKAPTVYSVTGPAMCDLGLCLDLFHVWDDPDLAEYLGEAADRITLVQIGDCVFDGTSPEKAVPGDGVVPLAEIIGQVARAGYNGVFDLELAGPRIDEEGNVAAARRGVAFLESALALE